MRLVLAVLAVLLAASPSAQTLSESFDAPPFGVPDGWSRFEAGDADAPLWAVTFAPRYFETRSAASEVFFGEGAFRDYLVSPPVAVAAGDVLRFAGYADAFGPGTASLEVRAAVGGGTDPDAYALVAEVPRASLPDVQGGRLVEVDLAALAGQTVSLALVHAFTTPGNGVSVLSVDDLTVGPRPTEPLLVLTDAPDPAAFVEVGTTATLPVRVENRGGAPLTLGDATVAGDAAFAATSPGGTLAVGAQAVIPVTFTPGAPGSFAATLTVESDGGAVSVPLAGSGAVGSALRGEIRGGAPVWQAPTFPGGGCEPEPDTNVYDPVAVSVAEAGTYRVTLEFLPPPAIAADAGVFGSGYVYLGAFDPDAPCQNLAELVGPPGSGGTVDVAAGQPLTVVAGVRDGVTTAADYRLLVLGPAGVGFPVDGAPQPAPGALALRVAGANPGSGAVALVVEGAGAVAVEAFDVLGRRVAVLLDAELRPGAPRLLRLDGVAPGVYTVRARAGDGVVVRRVTLGR